MPIALSLLAWLLAVGHITARYTGRKATAFWLKPLPIVIFCGLVLTTSTPVSPTYQLFVFLGLLFSMAGDILLALPRDRFIFGLISFLAAHLCYIAAFASRASFSFYWQLTVIAALFGAFMLILLWPQVAGSLRIPVTLYMAVILFMGWVAAAQWMTQRDSSAFLAMCGAILFIASDSLLALNRFRSPFAAADAAVMSTYYAAQWLIALSVQK